MYIGASFGLALLILFQCEYALMIREPELGVSTKKFDRVDIVLVNKERQCFLGFVIDRVDSPLEATCGR